jgi:hypothetical protein
VADVPDVSDVDVVEPGMASGAPFELDDEHATSQMAHPAHARTRMVASCAQSIGRAIRYA